MLFYLRSVEFTPERRGTPTGRPWGYSTTGEATRQSDMGVTLFVCRLALGQLFSDLQFLGCRSIAVNSSHEYSSRGPPAININPPDAAIALLSVGFALRFKDCCTYQREFFAGIY